MGLYKNLAAHGGDPMTTDTKQPSEEVAALAQAVWAHIKLDQDSTLQSVTDIVDFHLDLLVKRAEKAERLASKHEEMLTSVETQISHHWMSTQS